MTEKDYVICFFPRSLRSSAYLESGRRPNFIDQILIDVESNSYTSNNNNRITHYSSIGTDVVFFIVGWIYNPAHGKNYRYIFYD